MITRYAPDQRYVGVTYRYDASKSGTNQASEVSGAADRRALDVSHQPWDGLALHRRPPRRHNALGGTRARTDRAYDSNGDCRTPGDWLLIRGASRAQQPLLRERGDAASPQPACPVQRPRFARCSVRAGSRGAQAAQATSNREGALDAWPSRKYLDGASSEVLLAYFVSRQRVQLAEYSSPQERHEARGMKVVH